MPFRGSNDISLERAIVHLTKAFNNPRSENVCAVTMGSAALRIEEEIQHCTTMAAKMKFVNAYPNLLRAGMHFLTANNGILENMYLKQHLYQCACNMTSNGMWELHSIRMHWFYNPPQGVTIQDVAQQHSTLLLYAAVNIISNCMVLSLSRLTQHKYRGDPSSNADDNRTLQKWPQAPADLFPNGLEQSFKGLEGWAADEMGLTAQQYWEGYVPVEYSVYRLIGQLVAYHEPFGFSLLNFPKIAILLAGPAVYLQEAGRLHKAKKFKAFERVLRVVLDFYDAIEGYDHIQFQAVMEGLGRPLQNWWMQLNDVLARRPEWRKLHRRVHQLAVFATKGMCELFNGERPTVPFEDFCVEPKLSEEDRLEDAFKLLVRTRKAGCLNWYCTPSAIAQPTRICGRCQVVRYCGEKCQKRSWKEPLYPHKELCARIESLRQEVGAADWEKMWMVGFTFAAFQAMIKDKPIAAELVKSIGGTIAKVIALKVEKRKEYVEAWKNSSEYALEEEQFKTQMFAVGPGEATGFLAELDRGPVRMTELTHPVLWSMYK